MKKEYFLYLIIFLSIVLNGLYFEYSFCFSNLMLGIYILICIFRNKKIILDVSKEFCLLCVLSLVAICIWFNVVDKGMHIFEVIRLIQPILFYIALKQSNIKEKNFLKVLILFGIIVTGFNILGLFNNKILEFIVINNRLSSIFRYANVFGLYMLINILILKKISINKKIEFILEVLFLMQIVLTYSRAIYILVLLVYIILGYKEYKCNKKEIVFNILKVILVYVIYSVFFKTQQVDRINNLGIGSSEFYARLLYYKDSINIIFNNIWGLGYDGYYNVVGKYATGFYKVRLVHNSFLQIGLNLGILGMMVYILLFFYYFKNNFNLEYYNIIFLIIVLHSMIDFTLQFMFIYDILILLIYFKNKNINKDIYIKNKFRILINSIVFLILTISLILFISMYSLSKGDNYKSLKFYKYNTEALTNLAILEYKNSKFENSNFYVNKVKILNNIKRNVLILEKDIYLHEKMYKKALKISQNIVKLDRMDITKLEEYTDILINCIINKSYTKGYRLDCKNKMLHIKDYILTMNNKVSYLGKKQKRLPTLFLTNKIKYNIQIAKNEKIILNE